MSAAQSVINDPRHWRVRAEEARVLAEGMKDPLLKQTMLQIAKDYDRLAQRTELRGLTRREHKFGPP